MGCAHGRGQLPSPRDFHFPTKVTAHASSGAPCPEPQPFLLHLRSPPVTKLSVPPSPTISEVTDGSKRSVWDFNLNTHSGTSWTAHSPRCGNRVTHHRDLGCVPFQPSTCCQSLLNVSPWVPSFSGYCHCLSSQTRPSIRLRHGQMLILISVYFNV